VFIGYRHYDRMGIAPLFPFGHGLGYTGFDLSGLVVEPDGSALSVTLTNTGSRAGATVVQIYVGDTEASVPRPAKELKAFAKVTLQPGEARALRFALTARDFAFFDVQAGLWRVEPGSFTVTAGLSATDLRASAPVRRQAETLPL
jgi:beta-glucosidase